MTRDARTQRGLVARLALLMAFSSIATDLYLPALPRIAGEFAVPVGAIEASVASFLAGFVVGQLVWGPLGDNCGRKRPMFAGVALFLASSAGCALSDSAEGLALWRLVQGFGGAAAVVLARATIRDLFEGDDAARALSSAIALMALAPLLGPLAGAQILRLWSWQAIFWVLCAVAALALLMLCTLPETRLQDRRAKLSALAAYRMGLGSSRLMRSAGIGACYYAGMFGFIAAAPAVFISRYAFTPTLFGALLALGTALIVVANLMNIRLVGSLGYARTLRLGTAIALAGAVGATAAGLLAPGEPAPLIAALMVYMAMAGLVVANSLAGALDSLEALPGAASALAGAAHFGGGAIGAALAAAFVGGNPLALGWLLLGCGALAALFAFWEQEPVYKAGDRR